MRSAHRETAAGLVALLVASSVTAAAARSIPAPARSIAGLAFDGQSLWCADRRSRTLFCVDPGSGKLVRKFAAPGRHAAGLDWGDGHLWHVDGRTRKIYKIRPKDGKVVRELAAPGSDPPGLVRLGDTLVVGDWNDGVAYTLRVTDGALLKTRWTPLRHPWGMACAGARAWFAKGEAGEVVAVDLARWQAVGAVPVPPKRPTGVALDGDALWVAGMDEGRLWRVPIGGGKARHVVRRETRRHVRVVTEVNRGPGTLTKLACCLVLPVDKPGQRIVGDVQFQPKPLKVEVDERGQRVARYEAANVPPGGHVQMAWSAVIEFEAYRWTLFPEHAGKLSDVPKPIRTLYTRNAPRYTMDHAAVRLAAREAVGSETELFWQARAVHDYVLDRLSYVSPGWRPAAVGLLRGSGVCDDYSSLFVALCRANGIPARVMIGQNHVSAEVYFPGIGAWFPLDPTADDKPGAALWPRCHAFGLSSRIITHIENDADPAFWKPKFESGRPRTRVTSHVGERVVPRDTPPGPVFSGILNLEDKGTGKPLVLEWAPAYEADGHLPVRYEVCLVPSTAPVDAARATKTVAATRCELDGLKSGATYCVRVVPVSSTGQRMAAALRDAGFVRQIRKR